MFKVTNLQTNKTDQFEDRDGLLSFLDDMQSIINNDSNAKQITYVITHLNHEGEVIDSLALTFPDKKLVEELTKDFGFKKDKPNTFQKLLHKKAKSEVSEKDSETISDEKPDKDTQEVFKTPSNNPIGQKAWKLFSIISIIGLVILSAYSYIGFQEQKTLNTKLETKISILQDYQKNENKVDSFARYFLPNYYTGEISRVTSYIDESLKQSELPKGQLQSIILEDITFNQEKDKYSMVYIIYVTESDSSRIVRCRFDIVKNDEARYGFTVVSSPAESSYP
ncbi:hypothetical protein ACTGYW_00505 [Streptococcus suis]